MITTSEAPSIRPRKRLAASPPVRRTVKATVILPIEVDTRLSILAAIRRTDRSTLVAEALAPLLKGLVVSHRGDRADSVEIPTCVESAA